MPKKVEAWMSPGPNGPSLYLSKGEALKHEFLHYLQGSFGNPEEMNPSVEDVLQFAREVLEEIEGKIRQRIWKPFCKEDLKVGKRYLFLSTWWNDQWKTPIIGFLDEHEEIINLVGNHVGNITHYTSFEDGLPKPGEEAEVLLPWVPAKEYLPELLTKKMQTAPAVGLWLYPVLYRAMAIRKGNGYWIDMKSRGTTAPDYVLDIDQIPFPEDSLRHSQLQSESLNAHNSMLADSKKSEDP